jgi:Cu+-exporting ATPase
MKIKDPVCGMELQRSDSEEHAVFGGKTYYFCSADCKDKFDEDPGRWIGGTREREGMMIQPDSKDRF